MTTPPVTAPRAGLRERKKARTREAIQRAALRLIEEQGYDATTVEQIAAAADVAPRTFFRYFPTKEDVILSDDYDPLLLAELANRPAHEPPVEALRQAMQAGLAQVWDEARDTVLARTRLSLGVPALRSRLTEQMLGMSAMLRTAFAERTGRDADDVDVRFAAAAVTGAVTEAVMAWAEGSDADLPELTDRALAAVQRGVDLTLGAPTARRPPGRPARQRR